MPVVLMGGVKDGIDTAKAIALGAHAVAMGTSAIIAGGCIACLQCHVGQCVVGIATQDPEHEKRYDVEAESWHIHRFLEAVRWQLASVVHAHGYSSAYELSREDLVALTPEAAAITRLEYAPDLASQGEALAIAAG
jgi:glutamate synthase domain-containing protein 2